MFIIICGNIGLLIDSIRHTTCLTLRTAAGYRSHQSEGNGGRWKKRLLTRRQRSYILIAVLWIVPIIYVLIPIAGWSCAEICQCLSQCFSPDHEFQPSDYRCSRAFPPMANSWMALVVGAWGCLLLGVIYFLKRSIQQVNEMWSRCHSNRSSERKNTDASSGSPDSVRGISKRNGSRNSYVMNRMSNDVTCSKDEAICSRGRVNSSSGAHHDRLPSCFDSE
uniref:Uncharacterized protein n=1 Tax=Ciona intestinalis TaxID=7719 RepID=F6SH76_CIOIN